MSEKLHGHLKNLTLIAGGFALLWGLLGMIGMMPFLVFFLMPLGTALCFFLGGCGLIALSYQYFLLAGLCGGGVAFWGGMFWIQHLFGLQFEIEKIFWGQMIVSHIGSMDSDTAVSFILTGGAILAMSIWRQLRWAYPVAGMLASIPGALGTTVFAGYMLSFFSTYNWAKLADMSFYASLGLMILNGGIVVLTWHREMAFTGKNFPRWLPLMILISVITASIFITTELYTQEQLLLMKNVKIATETLKNNLETEINQQILALKRMGNRWEVGRQPNQWEWKKDAQAYIQHHRAYQAIEWVEPTFTRRWIVLAKGKKIDFNLLKSNQYQQLMTNLGHQQQTFLLPKANSADSSRIFLVITPLYTNQRFEGIITAYFHVGHMLDSVLSANTRDNYAVQILAGENPVYESRIRELETGKKWTESLFLQIDRLYWQIRLWPLLSLLNEMKSPLPLITLLTGCLMAFVLSWAVYMSQKAHGRIKIIEKFREELELEMQERYRAEQALQRSHEELEERVKQRTLELSRSNKELAQFAYIASHDLQEPLRKIRNFTDLLAKRYQGQLDAKADKYMAYIIDGAGRMQALIEDLLAYSRTGRKDLQKSTVNLGDILQHVLSNLDVAIEETQAKIQVGPMPLVEANATMIKQLFQNLIANAIKFHGKKSPHIEITAKKIEAGWQFSVRDNGIGIKLEHMERIFEVFQRLHSRQEYTGTGIGLAICKRIVERHGGQIWVESQSGQGSTFYFTLIEKGGETEPC